MSLKYIIYIASLAVISAVVGCRPPAPTESKKETPAVEAPAVAVVPQVTHLHALAAVRADGQGELPLGDFKGSPLILHFFGPWTDNGGQAIDTLRTLETTGMAVLPVVVDQRPADKRPAIEFGGWSGLPAVVANESLIKLAGDVRALPTTVLVGPDGNPVMTWAGHVATSNILAAVAARTTTTP